MVVVLSGFSTNTGPVYVLYIVNQRMHFGKSTLLQIDNRQHTDDGRECDRNMLVIIIMQ